MLNKEPLSKSTAWRKLKRDKRQKLTESARSPDKEIILCRSEDHYSLVMTTTTRPIEVMVTYHYIGFEVKVVMVSTGYYRCSGLHFIVPLKCRSLAVEAVERRVYHEGWEGGAHNEVWECERDEEEEKHVGVDEASSDGHGQKPGERLDAWQRVGRRRRDGETMEDGQWTMDGAGTRKHEKDVVTI
jgi:hypothetical protein